MFWSRILVIFREAEAELRNVSQQTKSDEARLHVPFHIVPPWMIELSRFMVPQPPRTHTASWPIA